ncbi:hypothetical protein D3C72_2477900 [compost metagenome]
MMDSLLGQNSGLINKFKYRAHFVKVGSIYLLIPGATCFLKVRTCCFQSQISVLVPDSELSDVIQYSGAIAP